MKRIAFWRRKLSRQVIQEISSRLYFNPDPILHKSILVAGTARTGTAWVCDLINSQHPSRVMFEPFNPDLVTEYRAFHYFQYMRTGTENPEFHAFAHKVFTGDIRNRWIDHQNERIFSEYRLIKEIRANLSLKWLHDNFPEVPIVFLIRHPCAVIASRMGLGWATDSDIQPFLLQPLLVTDYLSPYMDLIKNAGTDEEKHAIIWSVSNLVPLKQFGSSELKIVYYEDLCTQPEVELPSIFESIGEKYTKPSIDTIDQPSQTTRETSAVVTGADKTSNWQKKLTPKQIDGILRIVQAFGLGHLYDDSVLPLRKDAI